MKPLRVLLVDRQPVVLAGLRTLLAAQDPPWEICAVAGDGLEAVARAVSLAPDVVIMGYKLPRLNGLEAALEIRKRAPAIGVLLFTGVESPALLRRLFHSRVRGCMLKQEELAEVIPALETIRRHHRFRSRAITEWCERCEEEEAGYGIPTRRESEALPFLAEGLINKEVAEQMGLSSKTVETHRASLLRKFHTHSVVKMVRRAIRCGLLEA